MEPKTETLLDDLLARGLSRREFLAFCTQMSALLALPPSYEAYLPVVLNTTLSTRPQVVWLEFQDCAGNTESFLRATKPTVAELVLDIFSVNYHETLMAAQGAAAEKALQTTLQNYRGKYILVVEGAIPAGDSGVYCTIAGRTALDLLQEASRSAAGVIAVGTCASYGGLPAAVPNPTGAISVQQTIQATAPGVPLVNLPGCPMNVTNLVALLVHFLTFKAWPPLDSQLRPTFAYKDENHEHCERHDHYEEDRFVRVWGDEGHRKGWCLLQMGCRGPLTHGNCPVVRWNEGTSWPVAAGHGCLGCTEPQFWDKMTPFYVSRGEDEAEEAEDQREEEEKDKGKGKNRRGRKS